MVSDFSQYIGCEDMVIRYEENADILPALQNRRSIFFLSVTDLNTTKGNNFYAKFFCIIKKSTFKIVKFAQRLFQHIQCFSQGFITFFIHNNNNNPLVIRTYKQWTKNKLKKRKLSQFY